MKESIVLKDIPVAEAQSFLQHAIAPRPICLASTIDAAGVPNLSPFSFFNLFSTNPPIVIFSPARRVRNNTTKHTLENILEVPEVVINIVDYGMVQQVSLSSCEYAKGTDEFLKAGLTKEPATCVRPFRVRESKVQLECKVQEVKSLGSGGGAGNLILAEVVLMHVDKTVLGEDGQIDQRKLQHVARLGKNWYARITPENLFEVEKPNVQLGIGVDSLPETIRTSRILTGNHLGKLANVHEYPQINPSFEDKKLTTIIQYFSLNPREMERELHTYAAALLDADKVSEAWQILLTLE